MFNGPCMCSDEYCSSCGNPELLKFEESFSRMCEGIDLQLEQTILGPLTEDHVEELWNLICNEVVTIEEWAFIENLVPSVLNLWVPGACGTIHVWDIHLLITRLIAQFRESTNYLFELQTKVIDRELFL